MQYTIKNVLINSNFAGSFADFIFLYNLCGFNVLHIIMTTMSVRKLQSNCIFKSIPDIPNKDVIITTINCDNIIVMVDNAYVINEFVSCLLVIINKYNVHSISENTDIEIGLVSNPPIMNTLSR